MMESVDWVEAAQVQQGSRQFSMSGPREIAAVGDSAEPDKVTVFYTDGTLMEWHTHELLAIIPEVPAR